MTKLIKLTAITMVCSLFLSITSVSATYDGNSGGNEYNPHTLVNDFDFQATLTSSGVETKWNPYYTEGFNYYKVVRSVDNPDPVYPDDGYIKYSSDKELNHYLDAKPIAGKLAYYRVCSIAKPDRYCSNVVKIEVPADWNSTGNDVKPYKEKKEYGKFNDIAKSDWAYDYAMKLNHLGVMKGADGKANPKNSISRIEAVALLIRAYEQLNGEVADTSDYEFLDVNEDFWGHVFLQKALSIGMIAENPMFYPTEIITRAQFSKIIVTSFFQEALDDNDGTLSFSDIKDDYWAKKYIRIVKNKEFVNGYSDGTFKPNAPVSRAEVFKIIVKALETLSPDMFSSFEEI